MKKPRTNSGGNVFLDLGFDPAEAEVLAMRADLMMDLSKYIKAHDLTQADAARLLCVTQSRVSDLVRGKFEKFSLDMLLTMEGRLGRRFALRPLAPRRGRPAAA